MATIKTLLVVAITFLLFAGCKKDKKEAELPPATQEGKNTMGCRAYGAVKAYSGKRTTTRKHGVLFNYIIEQNSQYVTILGDGKSGQDGDVSLRFYANPLKSDTVYSFLVSPTVLTTYYDDLGEFRVKADDSYNFVKFTRIDDAVAAGVFQFRGYTTAGDSVYVTEGRFDIARD